MTVELSNTLLAAILAAQIAQIGFEARLLQRVSKLEAYIDLRGNTHGD